MAIDLTKDLPTWSISLPITSNNNAVQTFADRFNGLINKANRHEVLEYAGNPTGVLSANGPRLCFDTVGAKMYYKPRGSTGAAGWVLL